MIQTNSKFPVLFESLRSHQSYLIFLRNFRQVQIQEDMS